jgi:Tol biopolymer transport system component
MLCSDTLIPDIGLLKIDPIDGTDEKICLTKSSHAHPQWTHPHPAWSPDGSRIIFTSTREGSSHVFVVEAE